MPGSGFGSGNTTGITQSLVSPINSLVNLTISKQLSANLLVEVSYVGRFARDLLGQVDIASPVNLIDPVSAQTYQEAIREIYGQSFARVPWSDARAIPFFENVYGPELIDAAEARFGESFASAGHAFYRWLHGNLQPEPNAAISLGDQLNIIENTLGRAIIVNNQAQFFGLFGNFSKSNYNGLNVTVRKRFADSFGFDLNYTLSKSLDITSASEAFGNRPNGQTGIGLAEDPWNPELSYALSDFDRRHQFNGNFLAQLPFGRGRMIGGNVSGIAGHIIGGWEIGGIVQASTGRPFNFTASNRFQPPLLRPVHSAPHGRRSVRSGEGRRQSGVPDRRRPRDPNACESAELSEHVSGQRDCPEPRAGTQLRQHGSVAGEELRRR